MPAQMRSRLLAQSEAGSGDTPRTRPHRQKREDPHTRSRLPSQTRPRRPFLSPAGSEKTSRRSSHLPLLDPGSLLPTPTSVPGDCLRSPAGGQTQARSRGARPARQPRPGRDRRAQPAGTAATGCALFPARRRARQALIGLSARLPQRRPIRARTPARRWRGRGWGLPRRGRFSSRGAGPCHTPPRPDACCLGSAEPLQAAARTP